MPNPDIWLLFSHRLTEQQVQDLQQHWQVRNFHYLPPTLQNRWTHIPHDLETIARHLDPLKKWLAKQSKPDDLVLIQGDFGAVYQLVNHAWRLGLKPIYATTMRQAIEQKKANGEILIERVFHHQRFRLYEQ